MIILALLFTMGAMAKVSVLKSTINTSEKYSADGTYTWSQQYGNSIDLFTNLNGKISSTGFKHLKLKVSNISSGAIYRILVYLKDNTSIQYTDITSEEYSIDFSKDPKTSGNYNTINRISIAGQTDKGSLTILPKDVTLSTDDIETMTITTTIDKNSDVNTPFQWYAGDTERTEPITNNLLSEQSKGALLFGYSADNDVDHGYFNINGYGSINIHSSADGSLRLLKEDKKEEVFPLVSGDNIFVNSNIKCTSFKLNWGSSATTISSIDFISEYQAINTDAAFDIAASTGSKVAYDRDFVSGQPCTICLPFNMSQAEVSSIGKVYELQSISGGKATFKEITETTAYKPYLFIPSSAGKLLESISSANINSRPTSTEQSVSGGYSFVGTLKAKSNVKDGNTGYEIYGFNATDGKFVHVNGNNVSIKAFRAYIKVPTAAINPAGGALRSIDIDLEGTTGINDVKTENSSTDSYDTSGKKVGKNYKGVTISNGKKIYKN